MRNILHVDMDAFFASVEQHDRPELRGRPVIVGTRERGVVAAASYEARFYGIHSAMPTYLALKRCAHAQVVAPRLDRYREVSAEVFRIFEEFTPQIEGVSLDEAYLDITGSCALLGKPEEIARAIKQRILARTGLTASVGVAPNKLLAKIASDLNKPDGLCVITQQDATTLLDPLPVGKLPGIGEKAMAKLENFGIRTIGQLRRAPPGLTKVLFASQAKRVQEAASGIDETPVTVGGDEKQIGAEDTFWSDLFLREDLMREMAQLVDKVAWRLRKRALFSTTVTIKVRRSDFATFTRSHTFQPATQDTAVLLKIAQRLLERWRADHPDALVRLLGFSASGLSPERQADLFIASPSSGSDQAVEITNARSLGLDGALDHIRERFGAEAIFRGGRSVRKGEDSALRRKPTVA